MTVLPASNWVRRVTILALLVVSLFGLLPPTKAAQIDNPPAMGVIDARPLAATGRMTVDIKSIDYNVTYKGLSGMGVHVYATAGNLKGVPLRIALFFFTESDEFIAASSDTPSTFQTSEGALTIQTVLTPRFASSEWRDIPIFVPYAFFPSIQEPLNAYVIAVGGINGQKFTRFGRKNYFTLNP